MYYKKRKPIYAYLGTVLTRILAQFAVRKGSMAQQRRLVAVPPRTELTGVLVLWVVVQVDQMFVKPGGREDWAKKAKQIL